MEPPAPGSESLRFERCYCTQVTRATVLEAVRTRGCRTVEELQRATGACTGCRTCRPELEGLLSECRRDPDPLPPG
jgi:NAD(P)H-nitrite reductase large subunit